MENTDKYKVVNKHGMKPTGFDKPMELDVAISVFSSLNSRGFDDAPFTVFKWGQGERWFCVEGVDEMIEEQKQLRGF